MENRKFTRVGMQTQASLRLGDHVYSAVVANASLRGLFVLTEYDVPMDIPVEVSVRTARGVPACFDTRVVRREHDGVGLMIRRMNVSSFAYLRDLVAEKCQNPELMLRETKLMAGHILSA